MSNPTLLVMAAGLGSRYGGLKQIEPLGPQGEIILDYTLHDAWLAGFRRVVFVIKEELESTFEEVIGARWRDKMEVCYAYQKFDDLPGGYETPAERSKPWGTGQAVWAARHLLDGPFGVVGSDDFFGRDTLRQLYDFLAKGCAPDKWCMVGFRLGNTLSDSGTVSRGVCETADGLLVSVTERTKIARGDGRAVCTDGLEPETLPLDAPVSMNVWGFHSDLFRAMESDFTDWLAAGEGDPLKREYFLPAFVDRQLKAGAASAAVLDTSSRWYGVTYREDREAVMAAFAAMHADGTYPKLK